MPVNSRLCIFTQYLLHLCLHFNLVFVTTYNLFCSSIWFDNVNCQGSYSEERLATGYTFRCKFPLYYVVGSLWNYTADLKNYSHENRKFSKPVSNDNDIRAWNSALQVKIMSWRYFYLYYLLHINKYITYILYVIFTLTKSEYLINLN